MCILITVVILLAGLRPFTPNPRNMVERFAHSGGIRFYGQGIVFSRKPLVIQEAASGNASVTVEILVSPHTEFAGMVASILTLYDGNREQFIFGQWKKELIIRLPVARTGGRARYREVGVGKVLEKDTTHLIAVLSSPLKTDIYVDGNLIKSVRRFSLIPKDRRLSGTLILGNSPMGTNPWNGTFFGAAIHAGLLSKEELRDHFTSWQQGRHPFTAGNGKPLARYLFDGHDTERIRDHSGAGNDLLVPAIFHPLRRAILDLPYREEWTSRWNLMDITVNVLGFLPLGSSLFAWLRLGKNLTPRGAYGLSILLGFCLSIVIELAQAYIPTRDSSLLDLFSNTTGTAAGAFIFGGVYRLAAKIQRPKDPGAAGTNTLEPPRRQ